MRTRVAHMRTPSSFDFTPIERARRILETDVLQFLVATVPLQSAENSSHGGCSLSGWIWKRIAHNLNRMHQRGCWAGRQSCRNPLECGCSWAVGPVRRTSCPTPLIFRFFTHLPPSVFPSSLFLCLTCAILSVNLSFWTVLLAHPFPVITTSFSIQSKLV